MLYKHNRTGARLKVVTEWDEGDWFMVEDQDGKVFTVYKTELVPCLLYTSPSPRD